MLGRVLALASAVFLLALGGCSNEPAVVEVSGTATHKGEPVPNLLVTFQPAGGRPSWGITDAQGKFTLEYTAQKKGAMVGTHSVSAVYRAGSPEDEMSGKGMTPAVKAVQAKYGDATSTPMKVEIKQVEKNLELKFD
jgi:hypothetical protein